jgi:hypothetical protein
MSDFVHYDLGQLQQGSVVELTLDRRANVLLVDGPNFSRYRTGDSFDYVGGEAVRSPVRLEVPKTGHWHDALDLGGGSGTIRSSLAVIPR